MYFQIWQLMNVTFFTSLLLFNEQSTSLNYIVETKPELFYPEIMAINSGNVLNMLKKKKCFLSVIKNDKFRLVSITVWQQSWSTQRQHDNLLYGIFFL